MQENGWHENAETIVIKPEFEVWGWVDSPHFYNQIGWDKNYDKLKHFLTENHFQFNENGKPHRPKEAIEFILEKKNIPRSSSL